MFRNQPLVFGEIERLDLQILSVKRLGTGRGGQEVDHGSSLLLRREAAEPVFRHAGRRMPKRQLDGASLIQAEGTMPDLKSTRQM